MNKLQDVSVGILAFLTIVVAIEFWIATDTDESTTIDQIRMKDGHVLVTHEDLKQYIERLEKIKASGQITGTEVYRSIFNGVVRGFLMGLVLSNLEGGVVMAMMLGLINPVILYAERSLF